MRDVQQSGQSTAARLEAPALRPSSAGGVGILTRPSIPFVKNFKEILVIHRSLFTQRSVCRDFVDSGDVQIEPQGVKAADRRALKIQCRAERPVLYLTLERYCVNI